MDNKNYNSRLCELKIKSLEYRRIFLDLCFLFKIVHNLVYIPFSDYFTSDKSSKRGHKYKLFIRSSRLNCRRYSFSIRTSFIWNQLPCEIVETKSFTTFKSNLIKFNLYKFCKNNWEM